MEFPYNLLPVSNGHDFITCHLSRKRCRNVPFSLFCVAVHSLLFLAPVTRTRFRFLLVHPSFGSQRGCNRVVVTVFARTTGGIGQRIRRTIRRHAHCLSGGRRTPRRQRNGFAATTDD